MDDITLTNDYCPSNLVNFCDFEKDLCSFIDDTSTIFKWKRLRGRKSSESGPGVDHTTDSNSGYYLMLDSLPGNMKARIVSLPVPFLQSRYCLSWFYHMKGTFIIKIKLLYLSFYLY